MNVMRSFTLKSLKRNKKRTIVTIIGVIISAAMITAVTVFVASLVGMIQRSTIADGGNWHAELLGVPAQNISVVSDNNAVDSAVLSRDLGFAALNDSQTRSKNYIYMRQYGANGFDQMSVRLVSGRLPENSDEVLVSSSLANKDGSDYAIGSVIELELGDIVMTDGEKVEGNSYIPIEYDEQGKEIVSPIFTMQRTERYTVVGIMDPPGFESSWSAGYGILGLIDEKALSPDDTVNVYITAQSITRDIYDDIAALVKQSGAAGGEFNNELLRYYGVVAEDNVYSFLVGFMAVIILIIMISSISLIYNAFAISVAERSKQLGLLASVGATKRQKRSGVYYEGFFIGLIGIPAGILAGIGGIAITLAAIQPLLDSVFSVLPDVKLTLIVPPLAVAAAVVLSTITIFISAWIPARRASKIMPIDAIRLTKEVKLTRRVVKTSRLFRWLFGFEAEIAIKNLKRSRKRYRATILSLVISLVLFLTVSTYMTTTTRLSGVSYDGYNYDIGVHYSGASAAQRESADKSITALAEVDGFSISEQLDIIMPLNEEAVSEYAKPFFGSAENGQYTLYTSVLSLDDKTFSDYAKAAGIDASHYSDPENPMAILINFGQGYDPESNGDLRKISGDILNVSPGEVLSFAPQQSPASLQSLTIASITNERPVGVLIQGFYSPTFIVSRPVFERLTAELSSEDRVQNVGYTTYLNAQNDQQLEKQIKELTQGLSFRVNIFNVKSAARSEQNLQLIMGVFIYGFIILISLICIANIFNTVSTNIALRRREFAMLRSVGMTPKSFGKMIRFESIFYGLKGLLYGLPISVAIAYLLFGMEQEVLISSFTLPWVSYGFAVLMILVIVFATMLYSASKIRKENILDALKEETT